MNEEQNGHDPRVGVRIIVGPSRPSTPRLPRLLESPCRLARGIERKNNCAVSICTQARMDGNRRAKSINADAIEAAPNARYYGHEDPIASMPCGQAMGGQESVVHSLALLQYSSSRVARGGGWARNRDRSANADERMCALRQPAKRMPRTSRPSTHARRT